MTSRARGIDGLRDQLSSGQLFIQVAIAAQVLGTDPRTVRHGIEAGDIPAVRVGPSTIRIPLLPFLRDVCGIRDVDVSALFRIPQAASEAGPASPATAPILTLTKENDLCDQRTPAGPDSAA